MEKLISAIKRYSGYTRFVAPYWDAMVSWVEAHPQSASALILILAAAQFF